MYCIYSKLPPEDEQLIYWKHVEDIIGTDLKRKCIWLVLIAQTKRWCCGELESVFEGEGLRKISERKCDEVGGAVCRKLHGGGLQDLKF